MPDIDADNQELWKKYRDGDRAAYEELVEQYLPMVKITVGRMSVNVPTFVDREELYSAGCIGLLSAIEKYDPTRGDAKFTTYAMTRVRGAIIDELRRHDMLGRVTRDRVNRIAAAEQELINQGKDASDEEIIELLNDNERKKTKRDLINQGKDASDEEIEKEQDKITTDQYYEALSAKQATKMVNLQARARDKNGEDSNDMAFAELLSITRKDDFPGREMEMAEIVEMIFGMLDEKEKLLIVLYYNEELTLKEIGEVMKVTESRVCQIHSAMIAKIQREMKRKEIYM